MIFAVDDYLVTPYRPTVNATTGAIFAECAEHPERFLLSPALGDPQILLWRLLTRRTTRSWEVWRHDKPVGILVLDGAQLHFVFFDDRVAIRMPILQEFVRRCFAELGHTKLTYAAPVTSTVLTGLVRRKLGFKRCGTRKHAYYDGLRWHDLALLERDAGG